MIHYGSYVTYVEVGVAGYVGNDWPFGSLPICKRPGKHSGAVHFVASKSPSCATCCVFVVQQPLWALLPEIKPMMMMMITDENILFYFRTHKETIRIIVSRRRFKILDGKVALP